MEVIATDGYAVIVGLGSTGWSLARHLERSGRRFSLVDSRSAPEGEMAFRKAFPEVPVHCGPLTEVLFKHATQVWLSPGVNPNQELFKSLECHGAHVGGDIDLFSRECQSTVVAITGSNGKSTVTTLLGEMAKQSGISVAVGGNLGVPALDLLATGAELYILELSSFQLETTECLGAQVVTCLNMSADHMDRHLTFPLYHQAKHRIFRGVKQVVINRDDPLSRPLLSEGFPEITFGLSEPYGDAFGLKQKGEQRWLAQGQQLLLPVDQLKMAGLHNCANALAALALGWSINLPMASMLSALKQFTGLPHRTQWVRTLRDVRYINDSKATNVGASLAAIEGLGGDHNILLLAGGDAKDASLEPLIPAVQKHCKGVFLWGKDAIRLEKMLSPVVCTWQVSGVEEAVLQAQKKAQMGDTVLLSPACASWDMYKNYEDRGQRFVAVVESLQ